MNRILAILVAMVIGSAGLCGVSIAAPGDGGRPPAHIQNHGDRGHMQGHPGHYGHGPGMHNGHGPGMNGHRGPDGGHHGYGHGPQGHRPPHGQGHGPDSHGYHGHPNGGHGPQGHRPPHGHRPAW